MLANLNAFHTIIFFPDFCRCLEGWYPEGLNPVFTLALTTARKATLSAGVGLGISVTVFGFVSSYGLQ